MTFKKYISFIIFFFFINIPNVFSNEKIVFLDIDFIINKSKPAISLIEGIEKIKKKEIAKLKKDEEKFKKKNDEIIKTKNLISEEEFKNKVSSFRKELKEFDKKKKKVINDLNQKKNTELTNFLKQIRPIVEDYMKKNSIDIIIDKKNIFMAKTQIDITKDILELVNKKIK